MKAGDVFSAVLSPTEPTRHFWVVVLSISESGDLICVNITSYCFDKTTPVHNAEYPLLTQPTSYVNYPQIRIEPTSRLEEKIKNNLAKKCPSASQDLLSQIQEGSLKSKYTPNHIKSLLKHHLKKS